MYTLCAPFKARALVMIRPIPVSAAGNDGDEDL